MGKSQGRCSKILKNIVGRVVNSQKKILQWKTLWQFPSSGLGNFLVVDISHSGGAPHPLCSGGKHSTKVNRAFGPARSFSIESGPLLDNKALCRQLRVVLQLLYPTPPSILTLVTWVPQNRQGKLHPSLRGCSATPPFKWGSYLS